jgi:hypothetical protein
MIMKYHQYSVKTPVTKQSAKKQSLRPSPVKSHLGYHKCRKIVTRASNVLLTTFVRDLGLVKIGSSFMVLYWKKSK